MTNSEKESIAQFVIETAKKKGADQVAVNLGYQQGNSIQYRDGEIEQLEESRQSGLTVNLYCNHKYSGHSTNNLRKDDLKIFIEKAVKSTSYLTPDKFRELPERALYPENLDLDLALYDESYFNIQAEDRIKLVKEIYSTAKTGDHRIISIAAGYSDGVFSSLKMHSNGFCGHSKGTIYSVSAEVTVKDKDSRPEDWYSMQSRFINEFTGAEKTGLYAAQAALSKIGQSKIKTGKYNMLVENRAAIKLVGMLLAPMTAAAIQQKSSYLEGKLENQITSEILTVKDNPLIPGALGSRLFDAEGIASKERVIIEKGILKQFYVDWYYGRKSGLQPNGGSSSNLEFSLGNLTRDELISQVKEGILVTGFNGGNSNSTTGDFSFGISGFLFENGKIIKPVNEMNITGNAAELWKNFVSIGNDPYPYSKWRVPSLLFEGIVFSGI
ncbi:MAG: TldD/PmbA family protein [Bacteroidales bacterium]